MPGKNRIMIYGPKNDDTASETRVIRRQCVPYQRRIAPSWRSANSSIVGLVRMMLACPGDCCPLAGARNASRLRFRRGPGPLCSTISAASFMAGVSGSRPRCREQMISRSGSLIIRRT